MCSKYFDSNQKVIIYNSFIQRRLDVQYSKFNYFVDKIAGEEKALLLNYVVGKVAESNDTDSITILFWCEKQIFFIHNKAYITQKLFSSLLPWNSIS